MDDEEGSDKDDGGGNFDIRNCNSSKGVTLDEFNGGVDGGNNGIGGIASDSNQRQKLNDIVVQRGCERHKHHQSTVLRTRAVPRGEAELL